MDQLIGQILSDSYCIHSLLGRTQGRRTYRATHVNTNQSVVIKLVLFDPDFVWENLKLFEREAETLKSLDHKAIPKYLDSFEVETAQLQGFAIVQSYIEARSLQDWVTSGRKFSEPELKAIATELLEILTYLHQRHPPVIHRDLKPSNVLLGDRSGHSPGQVYLVDFGSVQTAAHDGTMTVVGTYGYMPLEQFGGRAVPASDLYSLGATLIYLATGKDPADLPQQDLRIQFESVAGISPSFRDWLHWLTAPNVSRRPSSAPEALNDIEQAPKLTASQSSSRQSPLNRKPTSKIQLEENTKSLKIEIPKEQIKLSYSKPEPLFSSESDNCIWGCVGCLGIVALIVMGLSQYLAIVFSVLILAVIIAVIFQEMTKIKSYRLEFMRLGNKINIAFGSADKPDRLFFSQEMLLSMSVAPHPPNHQLTINTHPENATINITGNRKEIQWLCVSLNEWTGRPVGIRNHNLASKNA